ncbi:unnamed protein product, partial [Amoebophrya sp. A25]
CSSKNKNVHHCTSETLSYCVDPTMMSGHQFRNSSSQKFKSSKQKRPPHASLVTLKRYLRFQIADEQAWNAVAPQLRDEYDDVLLLLVLHPMLRKRTSKKTQKGVRSKTSALKIPIRYRLSRPLTLSRTLRPYGAIVRQASEDLNSDDRKRDSCYNACDVPPPFASMTHQGGQIRGAGGNFVSSTSSSSSRPTSSRPHIDQALPTRKPLLAFSRRRSGRKIRAKMKKLVLKDESGQHVDISRPHRGSSSSFQQKQQHIRQTKNKSALRPSVFHSLEEGPRWKKLLDIVGDRLFLHLLSDCRLFMREKSNSGKYGAAASSIRTGTSTSSSRSNGNDASEDYTLISGPAVGRQLTPDKVAVWTHGNQKRIRNDAPLGLGRRTR